MWVLFRCCLVWEKEFYNRSPVKTFFELNRREKMKQQQTEIKTLKAAAVAFTKAKAKARARERATEASDRRSSIVFSLLSNS